MRNRLKWWQRALSQLAPLPLDTLHTATNQTMQLRAVAGRIELSTRNAIYSYEDLYTSFARTFYVIKEKLPALQEVLILGFGLGSIPAILYRQYGLSPACTGVDHDGELLRQFRKYYTADHVETVEADAFTFLQETTASYDLICVDLFKDALVPKKFETERFLHLAKAKLRPGGVLLYNRLTMEKGLATATQTFYEHTFLPIFPDGYYVDTTGNWILVGEKPT